MTINTVPSPLGPISRPAKIGKVLYKNFNMAWLVNSIVHRMWEMVWVDATLDFEF